MRIVKKDKIKIIQSIIYFLIILFILYNAIFLINTSISKKDYFKLFGISLFCMENDLMDNEINKNDLVIIKEVQSKDLQEGDIIAYEINEKIRINKIIDMKNEYTTKSNKNYYPDIEKIKINDIVGKKVINIPFLGKVIKILQSKIFSVFSIIFMIFVFFYNRQIYEKKNQRIRKKKKLNQVTHKI